MTEDRTMGKTVGQRVPSGARGSELDGDGADIRADWRGPGGAHGCGPYVGMVYDKGGTI